jgi:ribonuclease HII
MLQNYSSLLLEAGTDERVEVASPVLLQQLLFCQWISKCRLNDVNNYLRKLEQLKPILESEAVSFAVTHLYPAEIDD